MINFIIPLMSRQVANNWDITSELFNRTLWSCYNQTSPNFRVIVVCHEIPELRHEFDERVEFISLSEDFAPIPKTQHEKMIDKGRKTHAGAIRVRELGGGYTMMVDADDLISNRIAEYTDKHPGCNGFYVKDGYVYFVGDNYFRIMHKFSSGTVAIVNYKLEDLPSEWPDVVLDNCDENPWIIRKKHGTVVPYCKEIGRELSPLPFKAAVYVLGSGENHSLYGKTTKYQSWTRWLIQLFEPKKMLKGKLKKEFSVDWL